MKSRFSREIPHRGLSYEDSLWASLHNWGMAAERRYDALQKAMAQNCPPSTGHILMENWMAAAECVMAYEKALGIKNGRTF